MKSETQHNFSATEGLYCLSKFYSAAEILSPHCILLVPMYHSSIEHSFDLGIASTQWLLKNKSKNVDFFFEIKSQAFSSSDNRNEFLDFISNDSFLFVDERKMF